MHRGYSFRPRPWALAAAAGACAAGIMLGNWQAGRADEKRAASEVRLVELRGEFVPSHTVLLDNKLRGGRPGYEVVTPLRRADGRHVLVNRGWIAAPRTRDELPAVRTPAGVVQLAGVERGRLPRTLRLDDKPGARVRQSLDPAAFAAETGLALEPYFLEQRSPVDDGLVRDWPRPDEGAEKNDAYALQWYSLAALAVVLALVFSFRREPPR